MRLLLCLTAILSLTACGGSAKRSADLRYDVRAYNDGIRWEKLPQAAVRIPHQERDSFLDEREELQEELKIDDFEITRMKMMGTSKFRAAIQIKWMWHLDTRGIVRTTTSSQDWELRGERWYMLKETHVRGDTMPGMAAKVEEDTSETESAGGSEGIQDTEGTVETAEVQDAVSQEDNTPEQVSP